MSVTAVSSSSIDTVHPPSLKQARVEKAQEEPKLLFDPEALLTAIQIGLKDTKSSTETSEIIAATTTEILHNLSFYQPSVVTGLFKKEAEDVQRTVRKLYTLSLDHSHYRTTLEKLEGKISDFLRISKKEQFADLIKRGLFALNLKPSADLQSHETILKMIRQASAQIEDGLCIFDYVDSEFESRFIHLFSNRDSYPKCKQNYRALCQNLGICKNEQAQMKQLKRDLFARSLEMQKKAGAFHEAEASPSRSQFFNRHQTLIWKVGSELIQSAFWNTFAEKKMNKSFLPKPFYHAVQKVNAGGQYSFNYFMHAAPKSLPVGLVENVWGEYLTANIADIGELMSHILQSLPEDAFKKLTADIKGSESPGAVLRAAIDKHLGARTFPTLKAWCDNLKLSNKRKVI